MKEKKKNNPNGDQQDYLNYNLFEREICRLLLASSLQLINHYLISVFTPPPLLYSPTKKRLSFL